MLLQLTPKSLKIFRSKSKLLFLIIITIIVVTFSSIPLQMAIARYRYPQPQAILTLGGGKDREIFTAKLAQANPSLLIWISSGSPDAVVREIFNQAGVVETRLHLDRRAVDTVTNFTTLVKDLKQNQLRHIYLITSDFHMRRAKAIAFWVLGSRGITFTSIALPSKEAPESSSIVFLDACRAFFWLITGHTGASLKAK